MPAPPSSPTRGSVEVEVRYAETDQMGIVHHANYLVWFELARTRLCADAGHPYAEIEAGGHLLVVSGAELRYLAPARYGDRVTITTWIDRLASRLMRFGYEVRRSDQLLVSGFTEHVWVERESRRPCRMPAHVEPAFRELAAGSGA